MRLCHACGVVLVCSSSVADVLLLIVGAKRLIPQQWRRHKEFDNIHKLDGVAVITVQLRYNGWITEMQNPEMQHDLQQVFCSMHSCCCCTVGVRQRVPPMLSDAERLTMLVRCTDTSHVQLAVSGVSITSACDRSGRARRMVGILHVVVCHPLLCLLSATTPVNNASFYKQLLLVCL